MRSPRTLIHKSIVSLQTSAPIASTITIRTASPITKSFHSAKRFQLHSFFSNSSSSSSSSSSIISMCNHPTTTTSSSACNNNTCTDTPAAAPPPPPILDIEDLHKEAIQNKSTTYTDPKTGFMVFTELAHLKRGTCCANMCRHCPYGWELVARPGNAVRKIPRARSGNKVKIAELLVKIDKGTYYRKKDVDDSDCGDGTDSSDSDSDSRFIEKIPTPDSLSLIFEKFCWHQIKNSKKNTIC